MHPDGGGLYLHVSKSGARSWIFRYMRRGRAREMGLGPLHTIPLKDARRLIQRLSPTGLMLACRRCDPRRTLSGAGILPGQGTSDEAACGRL
jgi:hypothetical protein